MRRLGVGLVAGVLALSVSACGSTAPSPVADLVLVDLTVGTGAEVKAGQTIAVHYDGYFYDKDATSFLGKRFATSENGDPFQFVVGAGEVIPGWDRGVVGMKVGGRRRLVVPPSLAYGVEGQGIIPPNSTLVFDIDVVEIVVDPEATPTPTPEPTPTPAS
jgi:FKBP-type peptidyl-prolyl cis-trans isomerase